MKHNRPHARWPRRVGGLLALVLAGVTGSLLGGLSPADAVVTSGPKPVFIQRNPPIRLLDSRKTTDMTLGQKVGPGQTLVVPIRGQFGIAADATAVQLNVTVDRGTTVSYLTIWDEGPIPDISTLNWTGAFGANANAATIPIGADGSIRVYNYAGETDVILDVSGWFVDHNHDDRYLTQVEFGETLAALPTNGAIGGDGGLLGVPLAGLTVLDSTAWTGVGTFVAPADGSYLLQANVGTTFDGSPLAGVGSTTNCRWSNRTDFTLGASITAGVTAVVTVPGLDTSNIGLPGYAENITAGTEIDLECQVDQLLGLGSRTQLNAALTATQVSAIAGN